MDAAAFATLGQRVRGGDPAWLSTDGVGVVLRTEAFGPTYTLVADASPFDLRGGAAILKYELATAGSAGGAAPLPSLSTLLEPTSTGYTLTAGAGTFSLSGQAAGTLYGRLLAAGAGSFSVAGQPVATVVGRRLAADAGAFALAGQDVALVRTGSYSLACGAAAFVLTGQDVALTRGTAVPDVPAGGGAMFSLPPVRKRRPAPEPEWDEEADDAGVLVAVGIL